MQHIWYSDCKPKRPKFYGVSLCQCSECPFYQLNLLNRWGFWGCWVQWMQRQRIRGSNGSNNNGSNDNESGTNDKISGYNSNGSRFNGFNGNGYAYLDPMTIDLNSLVIIHHFDNDVELWVWWVLFVVGWSKGPTWPSVLSLVKYLIHFYLVGKDSNLD